MGFKGFLQKIGLMKEDGVEVNNSNNTNMEDEQTNQGENTGAPVVGSDDDASDQVVAEPEATEEPVVPDPSPAPSEEPAIETPAEEPVADAGEDVGGDAGSTEA